MTLLVEKIEDLKVAKQLFHELEPEADISCFQSWGWLEAEMDLSGRDGVFLMATINGRVAGMALFFKRDTKRRGFVSSRVLYLNESGISDNDMFIEYNGFIAKRGIEVMVVDAFLNYLLNSDIKFDEIVINRILSRAKLFDCSVVNTSKLKLRINEEWMARYVDIRELRSSGRDYIATLSKNSRGQLRRSLKKYNKLGKLHLHCAASVAEALEYFDALGKLHQKYWQAKGFTGVFARQSWVKFHKSIINRRFDFSEVQLLKISAGDNIVGYIYSLIYKRHVYMIQTGFNYLPDKMLRPGYVCHYMAVEYNRELGADFYNFLAEDSQYKRSLSNGYDELYSISLQKNRLRFSVENSLLAFKKRVVDHCRGRKNIFL